MMKRQRTMRDIQEPGFFEAATLPAQEEEEEPQVIVLVPSKDKCPGPTVVEEVTESGFKVTKRTTWPGGKGLLCQLMASVDSLYDAENPLACAIAHMGTYEPSWTQMGINLNGFTSVICPTSVHALMALRITKDVYEDRPYFTFMAYDCQDTRFHRWLFVETVLSPQLAFAVFVRRCVKHFGKETFDLGAIIPSFTELFGLETLTVQQYIQDCEHDGAVDRALKLIKRE